MADSDNDSDTHYAFMGDPNNPETGTLRQIGRAIANMPSNLGMTSNPARKFETTPSGHLSEDELKAAYDHYKADSNTAGMHAVLKEMNPPTSEPPPDASVNRINPLNLMNQAADVVEKKYNTPQGNKL